MTSIAGTSNLTASRLIEEIRQGARFAAFSNLLPHSPKSAESTPTQVIYLPPRTSRVSLGFKLAIQTALADWRTLPTNPLRTVESIVDFARGGTDLTAPILRHVEHVFDQDFGTPEEIETLKSLSAQI
ncbi:MAG TPA: hypothetical protein PK208_16740 [Fibrobacteria bacterium]|mgnify:FL=1|nr:hypothetical protein [Fibrobacteria bacterium]